jgi:uncharacterized protein (TIGR02145 family)
MKSTKCFLAAVTIVALAFTFVAAQQKGTQKATPQGEAFYVPYPENLLAPYYKEIRDIYIKILKTARHPDIEEVFRLKKPEELDFKTLQSFAIAALTIIHRGIYPPAYRQFASANNQVYRTAIAEIEASEKRHKSIIEANKIYEEPLYVLLNKAASELSARQGKNVKGEFETTEQYNQRLKAEEQMFRDSSEVRFLKEITPIVYSIQKEINAFSLVFVKYDADKGIYTVSSDTTGWKVKHTGQIKASPEEASGLKNARSLDLKISVNPSDVYAVNYKLYVTKAEISHGNKKYIAEFPKVNNMREIVFRGSELWKENLAIKGLEYTFTKAIAKLEENRKSYSHQPLIFEGKTYKTVKINNTVWMAENLNYNAKGSKCHREAEEDKLENCDKHGRLYDWNTAKKVCPKGWHLPSDKEWKALTDYVGGEEKAGTKLKATSFGGNDDYGFAAIPTSKELTEKSGTNWYYDGYSCWWSATENSADRAYSRYVYYSHENIGTGSQYNKTNLCSIRCLQD